MQIFGPSTVPISFHSFPEEVRGGFGGTIDWLPALFHHVHALFPLSFTAPTAGVVVSWGVAAARGPATV